MFITFHIPVVSGFQLIVQVAPSLVVSGVRGCLETRISCENPNRTKKFQQKKKYLWIGLGEKRQQGKGNNTNREHFSITIKYGSQIWICLSRRGEEHRGRELEESVGMLDSSLSSFGRHGGDEEEVSCHFKLRMVTPALQSGPGL